MGAKGRKEQGKKGKGEEEVYREATGLHVLFFYKINKKMKSVAVPVNSIFGGEEYVKIKKSDWNKIMDTFNRAVSRNHLLEKYEKKISDMDKKIEKLTGMLDKVKRFLKMKG